MLLNIPYKATGATSILCNAVSVFVPWAFVTAHINHGHEGFLAMSNTKAILEKPSFYALRNFFPPFNKPLHRFADLFLIK